MPKKEYEKLIKKCLSLAKQAEGKTSPNPLVGAVIFDDDFKIISTGYHHKCGEAHAEVNAIRNADCDLKCKSIAVNLEPCSHHGKTPPCADMLIEKGFKRVIIGTQDPNPIVAGRGIRKLEKAGIEVISGILQEDCKNLNEIFFKNQIENKPFITLKTATTLDGKIACKNGDSKWITGEKARHKVQQIRNANDAIMTGSGTVIADNPNLTCRIKNGKNPIRIIVDSKLKTNPDYNVYKNDRTKVYILTTQDAIEKTKKTYSQNVELMPCPSKNTHIDLEKAISMLWNKGIKSIMIESGANLTSAIIQENLADKIVQFIAPQIIGDDQAISFVQGFDINKLAEAKHLQIKNIKKYPPDIMLEMYIKNI
ncbi:MAG: bifunctional diaminohydroxyphosphoribosylaminopyrimidine deaminase/5-amino-6-(5-phosphoribosylamino)uracil reductase RibD [Candidatus Gastranaerophilales bacterium]|nr:bifunctional diaminohydroxyphosphoribosylaminopyrimidine deaminase/5-amino-6-(5-phosphoribosylamino)uracil reductase RibD [Candidatus Gastranaerophilales bacterium]